MLIGDLPVRCARRYPKKDATVFEGKIQKKGLREEYARARAAEANA